jgi:hypothetical protein
MLAQVLKQLFVMELDYDPALDRRARRSIRSAIRATFQRDSDGRIRIIYVGGVEDLSSGRFSDTDVIGFNMTWPRLIFVAVPDDFKDRVFNRLLKGTSKAKGMGLGLYLVKSRGSIVKRRPSKITTERFSGTGRRTRGRTGSRRGSN